MEVQQTKNSVSLKVKGLHCYCSNSCSLQFPWTREENSTEAHSIPDNAQIKCTPLDIIKFYFWITLLQIRASTFNSTNHSSQNLLFRNIQIKPRFKACLFKHLIWITKMKDNHLNSPGHSSVALLYLVNIQRNPYCSSLFSDLWQSVFGKNSYSDVNQKLVTTSTIYWTRFINLTCL